MKKAVFPALFLSGGIALIIILSSFFPKYKGILIFLSLFLLGDLLLWTTLKKWFSQRNRNLKLMLTIVYWLPAAALFCLVAFGFILPFTLWNVTVKAVLLSLLMMTIVAKMIPLLVTLVSRLTGLVVYALFRTRAAWLRWVEFSSLLLGSALWLVLFLGMIIWVYDFKVTTINYRSPGIPASFNNFRIVQISDIHLGNWTCRKKINDAVELINGLRPDMIVFTGDMFTFSTTEEKGFDEPLKALRARYGIYSIMGNHDYGDYVRWQNKEAKLENLRDFCSFYTRLGWKLLRNQSATIYRGTDTINIIGVENWGANKRFQRYGDVVRAEKGINKSFFSILLSHDPSYWDSIISVHHPEISLTLSGHTHGGQFGIETSSFRWSVLSLSNPLWGGFYTKNKGGFRSDLYVNRGLGTVGYAGRVGIRPEITLIILHHSDN